MKIRRKLVLSILTAMLAILAGLEFMSYQSSRRTLVAEIHDNASKILEANVARLDGSFQAVAGVARGLAMAVETLQPANEAELETLIQHFLRERPEVFGSTVAFEPGTFPGKKRLVAPYYHRSPEGPVYVDLAKPDYDYPSQDWYRKTVEGAAPLWTEPYVDVGGGETAMVTFTVPFFRKGRVWGVATVDVSIPELAGIVERIRVGETGFAFLLSPQGEFLSKRQKEWSPHRTIFGVADEFKQQGLRDLGARMVVGEWGFLSMVDALTGKESWFAFGRIPTTGWSLAIVFPEEEMLAAITALHHKLLLLSLVGLLAIWVLVFLISRRITAPIGRLAADARRIAGGDFSEELAPLATKDEVGVLHRAFGDMKESLQATMAKLREETEMFEVAFSQMSDGLVIVGPDWQPRQHNRAAGRLLALPAPAPLLEHLGASFESSVPLGRVAESEGPSVDFRLTRRESEAAGTLHLACTMTRILGRDGALRERVLSVRDVTAEQSEELAKSNFLSLISHKLFTPLTVLQGMIMLLKDGMLGELSQQQRTDVDSMAAQVGKLRSLIEMLVNFVTIEESSLDESREEIIAAEFLQDLAKKSEAWFPEKHTRVSVGVDPALTTISFNGNYLRLIVGQLVDNGLKFNMSDPATIAIETSRRGSDLLLTVADNGIGIPGEFRDKIFDKFFQIEKYFTGNVEGVGLGLAYVKKIVESFGGSIEVRSEPGKGSTFTVTLPKVVPTPESRSDA